jgi:hypothetical protein
MDWETEGEPVNKWPLFGQTGSHGPTQPLQGVG